MPRVKSAMLRVKGAILGVNPINAFIIVLVISLLILFPPILPDYYLSILRDVLLWMALSVSWHFFSGSTKYISLGSAAFFGIGLYFAAKYLGLSIDKGLYPVLPLPVIVLLAGLLNFALALVIGLVTLRLRGIYFAILTFSISMAVMNLIQWWEIRIEGTLGTYIPPFDSLTCYYTVFLCTIAVFLLTTLLRRSKFGLGLKMIGESEEAAVHVGVNASMYKTLGFAISAMLMGFMGASWATRLPYVNTGIAFDATYSFYPAVMTLLGGIGTVYGPIIGATTLYLLNAYLGVTLVYHFYIILGSILIAIVILMPNGIMGLVEKIRTLGIKGIVKKIKTKLFGSKKGRKKS